MTLGEWIQYLYNALKIFVILTKLSGRNYVCGPRVFLHNFRHIKRRQKIRDEHWTMQQRKQ